MPHSNVPIKIIYQIFIRQSHTFIGNLLIHKTIKI